MRTGFSWKRPISMSKLFSMRSRNAQAESREAASK
jgi:hypothetical protein